MGKKIQQPTYIDSVIATERRDIQGEVLSIDGADISALQAGMGFWGDNHLKSPGFLNQLGRITDAKKILKAEDCATERQKYYWDKVKTPFIFASGYLYDDEDHPNAKAAAAILRSMHKHDSPLKIKTSVEGGIVARGIKDPRLLAKTKIIGVALTFCPANQGTLVEATNLQKSHSDTTTDELLIKSVSHLMRSDVPSFIDISNQLRSNKIAQNIYAIRDRVTNLKKALTAGYGGGAPTSAVGGQVMMTESLEGGKKDFKRIRCMNCGDDQVYTKYQIRCRKCNKNFDLSTLYKMFVTGK